MAEGRGFATGFGTGLAESVTPYHPWRESLGSLGLAHILDDLPPPKLLDLYLFSPDRQLIAKAEREAIPEAIVSAVIDVVHDSKKRAGATVEGSLTTCPI